MNIAKNFVSAVKDIVGYTNGSCRIPAILNSITQKMVITIGVSNKVHYPYR